MTYGDKEFTWNTGRNLESIVDGDNQYSYTYDENGIRTSKTVNGKTTRFNTLGGVVLAQSDSTGIMYFQYDSAGAPIGFVYNDIQYLYITNLSGDVLGITDAESNPIINIKNKAVSTETALSFIILLFLLSVSHQKCLYRKC